MFDIHMDLWIFWNLLCNFLGSGLARQHENLDARIFAACFLWGIWPHIIVDRAEEEWPCICVPAADCVTKLGYWRRDFCQGSPSVLLHVTYVCGEGPEKWSRKKGYTGRCGRPPDGIRCVPHCVCYGEMNTPCPWFAGLVQHVVVKAHFVVCWGLWGSQTWGRWAVCSRSWKFSWGSR